MRIAIAGGTGNTGARVARLAREAGHEPVVLSRSTGFDLTRGDAPDLTGCGAVVDATGVTTISARESTRFSQEVSARLSVGARRAGIPVLVSLSIVGAARAPSGYYAGKLAQERAVAAGPAPWTVLRATQFFEFAEQYAVRLGPLRALPLIRCRPVAIESVAAELLRLAVSGRPEGILEIAGPDELTMGEVMRAVQRADGLPERVLELPLPGAYGRALRDGTLLPGPDARIDPVSLGAWLAARR